MTHAIYIAVILVLAGVMSWLGRESRRKSAIIQDRTRDVMNVASQRHQWQAAAKEMERNADYWKAEAESNLSYYRIASDIGNEAQDLLDQSQASNRSLRGWNGRYRRRIAELEEELADERG